MESDKSDFLDALFAVLGDRGLTKDADDMAPWLVDWRGRYHGKALALASPASTEEVAALVKLCGEHDVAIVPQGGNSGMVGGATPDASGHALLVSLRRMNRIDEDSSGGETVSVEAGVILQTLHEWLEDRGRRFALTLGGKGSATVGGLISTNAGGTQVLRHGNMRALVEGVEAVLPDGQVLDALKPLKKDNRGYNLVQLLCGAEGTLGIVTRATLKTSPALIDRCVAWLGLSNLSDAAQLLRDIGGEGGAQLEGFEVLPDHCLRSVLEHIPGVQKPLEEHHNWYALVEFVRDREQQEAPDQLAQRLLFPAIENGLVADAVLSSNEAQAEAFWKIRDSISEAERAAGPAVQHDISVPVADMPAFVDTVSQELLERWPGVEPVAFGHLGDGNVHFHVKAPQGEEAESWNNRTAKDISQFVYSRVVDWHGSISAEHGIGQDKIGIFGKLTDSARLQALRAIKHGLDPKGIMNPGKLVPLAQEATAA